MTPSEFLEEYCIGDSPTITRIDDGHVQYVFTAADGSPAFDCIDNISDHGAYITLDDSLNYLSDEDVKMISNIISQWMKIYCTRVDCMHPTEDQIYTTEEQVNRFNGVLPKDALLPIGGYLKL